MKYLTQIIDFLTAGSSNQRYLKDLERWAKTEYSKDWVWAYNFMIENPGKVPTHSSGITI